jgi:hypothetical protein
MNQKDALFSLNLFQLLSPYMFRADLQLIIRENNSVQTAVGVVMRCVDYINGSLYRVVLLMMSSKPARNM